MKKVNTVQITVTKNRGESATLELRLVGDGFEDRYGLEDITDDNEKLTRCIEAIRPILTGESPAEE